MSVGRNEDFQSRSNMPLKETTVELEYILDVYRSSVEMSPYLVAVAVHNYKGVTITITITKVHNYKGSQLQRC